MYSVPSRTAPSAQKQIDHASTLAQAAPDCGPAPGRVDKIDHSEPIDARRFTALVGRHLAFARRHGVSPAIILFALEVSASEREEAPPSDLQAMMHGLRSALRGQLRRSDLLVQIGRRRLGVVLLDTASGAVPTLENRLGRGLIQSDGLSQRSLSPRIRLGSAVAPGSYTEGDATQLVMAAELALQLPRSTVRQQA